MLRGQTRLVFDIGTLCRIRENASSRRAPCSAHKCPASCRHRGAKVNNTHRCNLWTGGCARWPRSGDEKATGLKPTSTHNLYYVKSAIRTNPCRAYLVPGDYLTHSTSRTGLRGLESRSRNRRTDGLPLPGEPLRVASGLQDKGVPARHKIADASSARFTELDAAAAACAFASKRRNSSSASCSPWLVQRAARDSGVWMP